LLTRTYFTFLTLTTHISINFSFYLTSRTDSKATREHAEILNLTIRQANSRARLGDGLSIRNEET